MNNKDYEVRMNVQLVYIMTASILHKMGFLL